MRVADLRPGWRTDFILLNAGGAQWQVGERIMVADADDVAIGIYRSLGFAEFEREWLWQRNAPHDAAQGVPSPVACT